jgi:hypothetical protein
VKALLFQKQPINAIICPISVFTELDLGEVKVIQRRGIFIGSGVYGLLRNILIPVLTCNLTGTTTSAL